jgi:hypothetical protein
MLLMEEPITAMLSSSMARLSHGDPPFGLIRRTTTQHKRSTPELKRRKLRYLGNSEGLETLPHGSADSDVRFSKHHIDI